MTALVKAHQAIDHRLRRLPAYLSAFPPMHSSCPGSAAACPTLAPMLEKVTPAVVNISVVLAGARRR